MEEWTINFLNEREPLIIKGYTFADAVEAYLKINNDLSNAILSGADLSYANLFNANLSGANLIRADLFNANLSGADLSYADLFNAILSGANLSNAKLGCINFQYANLTHANLTCADLTGTDLTSAELSHAILIGADLDFSSLPLRCGSLNIKIDKRIACQLLYHTLKVMKSVDDEEVKAILKNDKVLALANQFHRVDECGEI